MYLYTAKNYKRFRNPLRDTAMNFLLNVILHVQDLTSCSFAPSRSERICETDHKLQLRTSNPTRNHRDAIGDVLTVETLYKNFPKSAKQIGDIHMHGRYIDPVSKQVLKFAVPKHLQKSILTVKPQSTSLITHKLNHPNNPYGRISSTRSEYVKMLFRFLVTFLLLGYSIIVLLAISYSGSYSSSHVSNELIRFFSCSFAICTFIILPTASLVVYLWHNCL